MIMGTSVVSFLLLLLFFSEKHQGSSAQGILTIMERVTRSSSFTQLEDLVLAAELSYLLTSDGLCSASYFMK